MAGVCGRFLLERNRQMKVLMVNDGHQGGSNVAMNRLHYCLKQVVIQSKILNRVNILNSPDVTIIPRSRPIRKLESVLRRITWRAGLNDLHCLGTFRIKKMTEYLEADVFNFH